MGLQVQAKSAAPLVAPGVLDPTSFYAWINILHFLTRGRGQNQIGGGKLAMLGPCNDDVGAVRAHFLIFGAAWAYFTLLAASVVAFGWFCASRSAPGSISEDSGRVQGNFCRP